MPKNYRVNRLESLELFHGSHTRNFYKELGDLIFTERQIQEMTQQELADEASTTPKTIRGLERGILKNPHFGTVMKVLHILGYRLNISSQ